MHKFRKFAVVLLFVVLLTSPAAWARDPREALSARSDKAIYVALGLNDLGGILRNICSPSNIEMLTSLMSQEEAQGVRMVASIAAQLPFRSVAMIAGMAGEVPFLQLAISMPKEVQPKMDRVAAGKATPEDIATLFLGEGGLMLAGAMPAPVAQKGPDGSFYLIDDEVAFAAKDDILVMALSAENLKEALGAMKDGKKRLDLGRRFESPNFYSLYADIPTLAAFSEKEAAGDVDTQALKKLFKAPLKMEVAFDSNPGSFLMSCAINIFESLASLERWKDLKPVRGANIFLTGEGKALMGMAASMSFRAEDLKISPEAVKIWKRILKETSKRGITESDIENMLTGTLSFVTGSHATILGKPAPGMYVALEGQKGAAAKILDKILTDEDFSKAVPVSPVKVEGWDKLVMVDPAVVPVPLLLGVKGDALFMGMVDPQGMDKTPDLSPQAAKMLEGALFGAGFVDTTEVWNYLRREVSDESSHLGSGMKTLPESAAGAIKDIFDADFPVQFVKFWLPTLDTSFVEVNTVDAPEDKRLLPRLLKAAVLFEAMKEGASEEEAPLTTLLTVKGSIEAQFAQNPKANPEELKASFPEVAFIETAAKDLYAGLQVAGDDMRLELIEQAQKFGLTGSAGLSIAPDGNPYDGQEVVWIQIVK